MTTKTFYPIDAQATGANHMVLQIDGAAPVTATTGTGWTAGTTQPTKYALMAAKVERAAANFGASALPSAAPDNTLGDCWRTASTLVGAFAAGNWVMHFPVVAVSNTSGQDGRVRVRVWKGKSATGSDAVEVTTTTLLGAAVTNLNFAPAEQDSSITWTAPEVVMDDEYLFFQMAWELTGAATGSMADILLRVGSAASITTTEFAAYWRLHPYTYEGYLFVHKPKPYFQALVNEAGGVTYPIETFDYDNVSRDLMTADDSYWFVGATLSLGAAALGREKGQVRLKGFDAVGLNLSVYASRGVRPGELDVVNNDHVTIWNEFRPWMKPAKFSDDGYGNIVMRDDALLGYYRFPFVVNLGAPNAAFVGVDRYVDVDFSASVYAADVSDLVLPADVNMPPNWENHTASTTYGANTPDKADDTSDTGTWWESTGNANEWIEFETTGAARTIRWFSLITAGLYGPRAFKLQYYESAAWHDALSLTEENEWSILHPRTWAVPVAHTSTRWRLYITTSWSSTRIRIYRMQLFEEGALPYEWKLDYGAEIISGSATTPDITVRFPAGFFNVHLAFNSDSGPYAEPHRSVRHLPVFAALPKAWDGLETVYTGCTYLGSTEHASHPASHAFDGSTSTYWSTTAAHPTGTLRVLFPNYRSIGGYQLRAVTGLADAAPNGWTFQGSNDGSAWTTLDTQAAQVFASGELKTYPLTSASIFKYFRINVTVNNGNADYVAVAEFDLLDGTDDDYFEHFTIENHQHTQQGQSMTFRIYDALDKDEYPDQALVMYWEEERYRGQLGSLYGLAGREHVKFTGWMSGEQPEEIRGEELTTIKETRLECFDIGRMLDHLPGFSVVSERTKYENYSGVIQRGANIDRFVRYLLHWRAQVSELTDFYWSDTGDQYAYPLLSADGSTIWEQVSYLCAAIAHFFVCDKYGRLYMLPDPQLQDTGDRTTEIIASLDEDDIVDIQYVRYSAPRVHWLWGSGIQANTQSNDDAALAYTTYFCRVPGQVPGQGLANQEYTEQLVVDQTELNAREGHRYAARLNAEFGYLSVKLAHVGDMGFDPGRVAWVKITLSAENAAKRGLTWNEGRFLLLETQISYNADQGTKEVVIIVEVEASGLPAETYTP